MNAPTGRSGGTLSTSFDSRGGRTLPEDCREERTTPGDDPDYRIPGIRPPARLCAPAPREFPLVRNHRMKGPPAVHFFPKSGSTQAGGRGGAVRGSALIFAMQVLDALHELGVVAAGHLGRVQVHLDVRVRRPRSRRPTSLGRVDPVVGRGDHAAVQQRDEHRDPHQPAPGARADHRAPSCGAGTRPAACRRPSRPGGWSAWPGAPASPPGASRSRGGAAASSRTGPLVQPLQEDVGVQAAAVEAAVDDQALLLGLAVVVGRGTSWPSR